MSHAVSLMCIPKFKSWSVFRVIHEYAKLLIMGWIVTLLYWCLSATNVAYEHGEINILVFIKAMGRILRLQTAIERDIYVCLFMRDCHSTWRFMLMSFKQ